MTISGRLVGREWRGRSTRGATRAARIIASSFWLAAVGVMAAGSAAVAQDPTGRIIGTVVNSETKAPLPGVQISVPSVSRGTLTDHAGRYVLLDVGAGTHTLVVSSLGYRTETVVDLEIRASVTHTVDVALTPQAVAVEGITVSAERTRGSSVSLLTDRRLAATVSDAIGAEQISRAPDGDVASALKRVPGVTVVDGRYVYVRGLGERYGGATLNGAPMPSPLPDRKTVPLDVIPSELLESVVTAKSYAPDQPGDYAGGLVQISTRAVPASRIIQLSASTGYNTTSSLQPSLGFTGSGGGFAGIGDGTPALPPSVFADGRVGLPTDPAAGSAFASAVTARFGPEAVERPLDQSYALTIGDRFWILGRAVGLVGTVTTSESYSAPADAVERLYVAAGDQPRQDYDFAVAGGTRETGLGSLASASVELAPEQRVTATGTYNRLTEDGARRFAGLYSGGDYFETYNTRYVSSGVGNLQLRGEHRLGGEAAPSFEWRASYGRAGREEPGTRTAAYRGTGPGEPVHFLPSQSSGVLLTQRLDEELVSAAADLSVPFRLGAAESSVAVGVSTDLRERVVQTRRILLTPVDDIAAAQHLPPDQLFVPERIGTESGQLMVADRTFAADNYDAGQAVHAAYLSLDGALLPRLRIAGGVRVERAEQTVEVTGLRAGEAAAGVPATSLEDLDLIPAANLTYALTGAMNIRAAVSRTLARPQFRELSPFLYADYFGDVPMRGNPYLVRSRIVNADARWEWFFSADGVASVGGFYKEFTDPIEPIAILLGTNPGRTFANTEFASIYGAELELRAPIGNIAPALQGLSLSGNLTLARSAVSGDEVVIYDPQRGQPLAYPVNRGGDRPLFGQSPFALNFGLSYFSGRTGTAATILYNRFGRRVDTTGGVALPDVYEEGRAQLDATLEQPLGRGMTIKLSAARLLGGEVEFTQAFPNGDTVTTRSYDLGRKFSLSLSWRP